MPARGVFTSARHGVQQPVNVCVPAHGFADVTITVRGVSQISGDPKSIDDVPASREPAASQFQQIALADELGRC